MKQIHRTFLLEQTNLRGYMAIQANRKRVIVDEMAKFDKGQIEFLFELIKESRIPGK